MQKLCIRAEKEENVEEFFLIVYPAIKRGFELKPEILGDRLYDACQSVVAHTSASMQDRLKSGVSEWSSRPLQTADLKNFTQIQTEKSIPYSGWVIYGSYYIIFILGM